MSIKWRLRVVMAEREMSNKDLCERTKLHPGTASKLKHNCPARIDTETLGKLCDALDCQPGDLLRYEDDANECS